MDKNKSMDLKFSSVVCCFLIISIGKNASALNFILIKSKLAWPDCMHSLKLCMQYVSIVFGVLFGGYQLHPI